MKRTRIAVLTILLSTCLALAGWAGGGPEEPAGTAGAEPIKIALVSNLSGGTAEQGTAERDGWIMAMEEVNEAGGVNGRELTWVIGDSQGAPDRATSLARRFIETENVVAIAGGSSSAACLAVAKVSVEKKVPMIGQGWAVPLYYEEPINEWFFGARINNIEFARAYASEAKKLGAQTVAAVVQNNAWGNDAWAQVQKAAPEYGLQVLGETLIESGATEVTAEVSRAEALNPDVLLVLTYQREQATVARGLTTLGWRPIVVGAGPSLEASVQMGEPEHMVGWFGAGTADLEDPALIAVIDKAEARFGYRHVLQNHFVHSYDAARAFLRALKAMDEPITGERVRDALETHSWGVELTAPSAGAIGGWKPGAGNHTLFSGDDLITLTVNEDGKVVRAQ